MNSVQRVYSAINKEEADQVPRGEFWLDSSLLSKMFPQEKKFTLSDEVLALKILGIDLRAFCPKSNKDNDVAKVQPAIPHIDQSSKYIFSNPKISDYEEIALWRKETDFFLFAMLDGVFQGVASLLDFNTFLMATVNDGSKLVKLIEGQSAYIIEQAKLAVAAGAHGILLAEDMAYNRGLYISPQSLRKLFFPGLKEVVQTIKKELDVPIFLHSDGNISAILEDIVAMGFDGMQGIESGAGMDLLEIKKQYGEALCLMGNLDVGFLAQANRSEIYRVAAELTYQAGTGGGFILGSSAGILDDSIPLENLMVLKEAVKAKSLS
jgi:uroporphyrinogen decarboxylase